MSNVIQFSKIRKRRRFQKFLPVFIILGISIGIGLLAYTSVVMDMYHYNRLPSIAVEPKI